MVEPEVPVKVMYSLLAAVEAPLASTRSITHAPKPFTILVALLNVAEAVAPDNKAAASVFCNALTEVGLYNAMVLF